MRILTFILLVVFLGSVITGQQLYKNGASLNKSKAEFEVNHTDYLYNNISTNDRHIVKMVGGLVEGITKALYEFTKMALELGYNNPDKNIIDVFLIFLWLLLGTIIFYLGVGVYLVAKSIKEKIGDT